MDVVAGNGGRPEDVAFDGVDEEVLRVAFAELEQVHVAEVGIGVWNRDVVVDEAEAEAEEDLVAVAIAVETGPVQKLGAG